MKTVNIYSAPIDMGRVTRVQKDSIAHVGEMIRPSVGWIENLKMMGIILKSCTITAKFPNMSVCFSGQLSLKSVIQ